nr:hypothetical protein [Candidatus Woesearchaeota archaeon]
MANKDQELRQDLEDILKYNSVTNFTRDFKKKDYSKGDLDDRLKEVGFILAEKPNLLLNETGAAILNETKSYQRTYAKPVSEKAEKHKKEIIDSYVKFVNKALEKVPGEVKKKNPGFDKLSPEDQKREIGAKIYGILGSFLVEQELNPNKDYAEKNREFTNAYLMYQELDKASEQTKKDIAADALRSAYPHLTSNMRNFRSIDPDEAKDILIRKIGKQFVQENEGTYSIDQNKFEEAFGNADNYINIAPIADRELYPEKYKK